MSEHAVAKLRSLRAWLDGPTCPMSQPQADIDACDQILKAFEELTRERDDAVAALADYEQSSEQQRRREREIGLQGWKL
jgi:hypothetical protein